jgi:CheY-like chemotaxis protein
MEGERQKCLEAGCDDFDTKPIEFKRLLEKINHWIEISSNKKV